MPARTRLRPPAHSSTFLGIALLRDAAALAALRNATAAALERRFGRAPLVYFEWTFA